MTWHTSQESNPEESEYRVLRNLRKSKTEQEHAYWTAFKIHMEQTPDNYGKTKVYLEDHPDEVQSVMLELRSRAHSSDGDGDANGDSDGGSSDNAGGGGAPPERELTKPSRFSDDDLMAEVLAKEKAGQLEDVAPAAEQESAPPAFAPVSDTHEYNGYDDPSDESGDDYEYDEGDINARILAAAAAKGAGSGSSTSGASDEVREPDPSARARAKVRDKTPDPERKLTQVKGINRYVYGQVEAALLEAGAFEPDQRYSQGDVVNIALAYLVDATGTLPDDLEASLRRYRRNSKDVAFEQARQWKKVKERMEDLMRSVTSILTLDAYMARRTLGLTMSPTPATPDDLELVDDPGQDEFYERLRMEGALQYERDCDQLGREITSNIYGFPTL